MHVTITKICEKQATVSRLSGLLHDARIDSISESASGLELRIELRRIGYEHPGPERRAWGLFRNRSYPWIPVNFVVSPVASLQVDRCVSDETELRNEFHAMFVDGMKLEIETMFRDLKIGITEDTSIVAFDSGQPIGPGLQQFGPPFDSACIADLLGTVSL
jgi:hypothetical protein